MPDEETEKKPAKKKKMVVNIFSAVLWLASIALSCLLKPGHPLAWTADALLLLGFFPLLWLWRRDWITFLFGVFNSLIGFFLIILQYLPDDKFTGQLQIMRNHLLQMHSAWTWLILGVVAILWGTVGMVASLASWIARRSKKS